MNISKSIDKHNNSGQELEISANNEVVVLEQAKAIANIEQSWNSRDIAIRPQLETTVDKLKKYVKPSVAFPISGVGFGIAITLVTLPLSAWAMGDTSLDKALPLSIMVGVVGGLFTWVTDMINAEDGGKSLSGLILTKLLRRKKYQKLTASEKANHAENLEKYKKEMKKQRKAENKILKKAQNVIEEYNTKSVLYDLEFENGKFRKKPKSSKNDSIGDFHLELAQDMTNSENSQQGSQLKRLT